MLAQALDVAHLEAAALGKNGANSGADGHELAIREDVAAYERRPAPHRRDGVAGDPVVQEDTALAEQAVSPQEVLRKLGLTDVLEHPHADELVVAVRVLYLPVIANLDAAAIRQPGPADALVRQFGLRFAQGDASCTDPVALSSVDDEPTPSTTDVKQALTGPQPQLAADVVELALLGTVQILLRRGEVRAGLDNVLVQPQAVELARHVVVVGAGPPVALFRVAGAPQTRSLASLSRAAVAAIRGQG